MDLALPKLNILLSSAVLALACDGGLFAQEIDRGNASVSAQWRASTSLLAAQTDAANQAVDASSSEVEQRVADLIEQLGDPSYQKRVNAEWALQQ